MKRPPVTIILLGILAFLLPIMGGQLSNDSVTLDPSIGATFSAIIHGMEAAGLQHAILSLFAIGALTYLLVKRKIVQVPHMWVAGPLIALVALLFASVAVGNYKWNGLVAASEWTSYAIILIATVAGIGRKVGPTIVLTALVVGCSLASVFGLSEYGQMKGIDPNWRIFGGWYNPNALAGILVIGFVLSLPLIVSAKQPSHKLLLGLCTLMNALAILLTGSKGGIYALAVGIFFYTLLSILWLKKNRKTTVVAAVASISLVLVLMFGLKAAAHGGGVASRVTNGASADQSSSFRLNLWKGAIELIKESPMGHGLGSYDALSAKPGITTRTALAHNTPLQLTVEGGLQVTLTSLFLIGAWTYYAFRGTRSLPEETNILKAGVVACVAAILANGLVESNLYYFGIGAAFFLLMGIGLQLSADAVAPEFTFKSTRGFVIAFALAIGIFQLYAGYVYKCEANVRYQIAQRNMDAEASLKALRNLAPLDGEAWYRSAFVEPDSRKAIIYLKKAIEASPTTKYYRALARFQFGEEQFSEAEASVRLGLRLDPNNLAALFQLLNILDRAGEPERSRDVAKQMIEVEQTPYYRIRSIPEQIPTETFEARSYLTRFSKRPAETIALLIPAIEGYEKYARVTVPYARNLGAESGGPISISETKDVMQRAKQTAQQLIDVATTAKDKVTLEKGQRALELFNETLAGFK